LSSHRSTYFRLFCPNVHDFLPWSSETLKIPLPIDVREILPCDHSISFRHIDISPIFPPKLGKLHRSTPQIHLLQPGSSQRWSRPETASGDPGWTRRPTADRTWGKKWHK
jgi:hypothetical protein